VKELCIERSRIMDSKKILQFLTLVFILSGCFSYSFRGALPSHIKSVAVPLFDDNTAYPGVREDLTNKVVDGFIADNTLRVVSESEADIVVSGIISSITQKARIVTSGEEVQEFQMFVNVQAKCEDIRANKVLWEKSFSQFGILPASSTQDERDAAVQEALEKISEDILNSTLASW
jgi:hypothetical protein